LHDSFRFFFEKQMTPTENNRAVFLDRDGTLNEEMGYINHISRFRLFDFAAPALKIFKEFGFKLIVITNQAGVARGYFDEELVIEVHNVLRNQLQAHKVELDDIYYCPHHPKEGIGKYKKDCPCRKPKIGMIEKAREKWNLDLSRSLLIGDRYKDIQMAHAAGITGVMVLTGYGRGEYNFQKEQWPLPPEYVFENILQAAEFFKQHPDKLP